ncbi:hypothetical protein Daura_00455 [Dactylosporangium aurantiacum]|uniref:Uncharacterized protein n=1 Tax=Dactylosporangium aurantiacum TaxID=35754 RepID=A0A9Q9MMJ6_9ACTN|nr:hypothetical protein [Dactylosporangium aurantiacum]MDG6101166.1 hypothetical protein [Dactylosporangium aurantiacum]UWZ54807.1 hypothetical protein Daura_00455 [Dactylosporangium aurantiacum]
MVEEQLRQTLERAAAAGPMPPADLLARVDAGHLRRRAARRAGWSGLAGVVVLVIIGSVALLPHAGKTPPVGASPSPSGSASGASSPVEPKVKDAAPVEQVWPQAVLSVPARSGQGTNEPVTMLDEHTVLLAVHTGEDKVVSLAAYDLRTKTERMLTELPAPPGLQGYWPGPFTAGDGLIVWSAYAWGKDGSKTFEYWSMRYDGTGKRRFRTADLGVGERVVVADGALYGGSFAGGGIVRVPLDGGAPAQVPGSSGYRLARWPWAVTAGPASTSQPAAWNLVTGERRTPAPRPLPSPWWSAADQDTWLGIDDNRLRFAQATDGSWQVTTNGFDPVTLTDGWLVGGTLLNLLHPNDPKQPALWDLRTGVVATYGTPATSGSSLRGQVAHPLAWWPSGERLMVFDPARVTP